MKQVKWMLFGMTVLLLSWTVYNYLSPPQVAAYKVVNNEAEITESKYIISEEMVRKRITYKSQLITYAQEIHKSDTLVEDSWLGERRTEMSLSGSYSLGLETKDIHIAVEENKVVVTLPQPKLIHLDLPYDKITFDKTKGFFRGQMSEDERKKFYQEVVKQVESEIMSDEELLQVAHNRNLEVVRELVEGVRGVSEIVFE